MIAKLVVVLFLIHGTTCLAQESRSDQGRLTGYFGPYVYHFDKASHNDWPLATGLEWEPRDSALEFGAVYFRNSFYQDSLYAYGGKRWFIVEDKQGAYLNMTGGLVYGYRGDHQRTVPFNHHGLGVAIAPIVGYQLGPVNSQLVVLGNAAIVLTFGYDFWR
jgi:hypothetical protein